jgi:hypothetical protein
MMRGCIQSNPVKREMLVVEDTKGDEIKQFVVMDASLNLGGIQAGTYLRSFNPIRVLSFYNMVESQLLDFSSRYTEAFRYMPRRAYDYLKIPPILSSLYQGALDVPESNWLVDFFMARPLVSVGGKQIPKRQQRINEAAVYNWSVNTSHSPRIYHTQDMRHGRISEQGWSCLLEVGNLHDTLKGNNRDVLLFYIKSHLPVFVDIAHPEEIDPLLKWLILLKEAGIDSPQLVLGVRSHKEWGEKIARLMDIPQSRILTSGATISSLSSLIRGLKDSSSDKNWSSRVVFASAYPETHVGDSISEILSYILSHNLDAEPEDIQRILGGNILSLLPTRPPFLTYVPGNASVVAKGLLGQTATSQLARLVRLLSARNIQNLSSFDFMTSKDGGTINTDSAVFTFKQPSTNSGTSLAFVLERDGSIRLNSWKRIFTENLKDRDDEILSTLVTASTKSEGLILDAPSHLNKFSQSILEGLHVDNPKSILSALHFEIGISKVNHGTIVMCPEDMRAIEVSESDLVLALDTNTRHWWAGRAIENSACPAKRLIVSKDDAFLYGLRKDTVVDLIKYNGKVVNLQDAVLAFGKSKESTNAETASFIHLHEEMLQKKLMGRLIGRGTRIHINEGKREVSLRLVHSIPELESGELGQISTSKITIRPSQAFREINVILSLSFGNDPTIRNIPLRTLYSLRNRLSDLMKLIPELNEFISNLSSVVSKAELSAIVALMTIENLRANQTQGRLGLVSTSDRSVKFSIQRGSSIQQYVEFAEDLSSDEVLTTLVYSVLDSTKEYGGETNPAEAFRSIAELLEDFGEERPTHVIVMGTDPAEDSERLLPFIQAIEKRDRYHMDIFLTEKPPFSREFEILLNGTRTTIYPIESFSTQLFDGYFMTAVDRLLPSSII